MTRHAILDTKATTVESVTHPALRTNSREEGAGLDGPQPLASHSFATVPVVRPQAKLTVNDPSDQYESEADQVASQVMSAPAPTASSPTVQREGGDEEELQMKADPSIVQREGGDEEELQMKADPSIVQREGGDEEELQMKADPSIVQREGGDEEELQMKADPSIVQRKSGADLGDADVSDVVDQGLAGGGQSLDGETKNFMESRFGHDFSQVRVHSNEAASESAKGVSARAYTVGSDIAFKQGEYQPGSNSGKELLAHELTHVVQQGAAARKEDTA